VGEEGDFPFGDEVKAEKECQEAYCGATFCEWSIGHDTIRTYRVQHQCPCCSCLDLPTMGVIDRLRADRVSAFDGGIYMVVMVSWVVYVWALWEGGVES